MSGIRRAALLRFALAWRKGEREGALVVIERGAGPAKVGEASPLPGFSHETLADSLAALCGELSARLEGRSAHASPLPPSAEWALRCALCCEEQGASRALPPAVLLQADASFAELDDVIAKKPQAVKLKVRGETMEVDLNRARQVRAALPSVQLRLDGNRTLSDTQLERAARVAAGLNVAFFEEPHTSPERCARELARFGVRYAVDETTRERAPSALPEHGVVVLKPTLLGAAATANHAHAASRRGHAVVVSSAYESAVGQRWLNALQAKLAPEIPPGTGTKLSTDLVPPPPQASFDRALDWLEQQGCGLVQRW